MRADGRKLEEKHRGASDKVDKENRRIAADISTLERKYETIKNANERQLEAVFGLAQDQLERLLKEVLGLGIRLDG